MLSQLVETSCFSQHNGCKIRLLDQLSSYRTSVQLEGGKEKDQREGKRRWREEREGMDKGREGEERISMRVS